MRILLVNKYYYLRSGTERYLLNLKRLLEAHGHTVEVFAMQHPRNLPATYARDFAPYIDYRQSPSAYIRAAIRVIWSPHAARQITRVLDNFSPDIVHLFNIYHHLSPSILIPIAQRGFPVVQTLNDYKLICPNYLLYTRDTPCIHCRNGCYFQAVRHRCLHGSLSWSVLAAVEMTLHKARHVYERHVATFIAPSTFVRIMVQAFGVSADQLHHVPYFFFPQDFAASQADGGYCTYVGRLSHEKGLPTLVRAMRRAPQVQLLIVGEGPVRAPLEKLVEQEKLDNVRFSGYLSGQALERALSQARFTILPSEWYEVFGQSILESFAVGKPVVAARIGGIPELIDEGVDGLLFTPGAEDELAACLRRLWDDPVGTRQMGLNGRRKVLAQYTPENHYRQLYPLYERLVNR